ncbi:unnamed protein product [Adineta steineri]|uniref:Fibronectin type-III domain-containing protein n=2 Tax=Adineta steineri TaxID=433720 RepID=A0A819E6A7_9BILA|nr:unnamed protein product [Adineta steineri]CAF3845205.1 unnamed protein product [Adineta steineri]
MSTTIIPDIYRHIARKSTVTRNIKPPSKNVSLCTTTLNIDNNCKEEQSIFDTIRYDIKLENEISRQERSFVVIPDNETEQMIVEESTEEIIRDVLEQMINQIHEDLLNQTENSVQCVTDNSTDIHNTIDSLMNYIDGNNNEQSIDTTNTESLATTNEVHMDDGTESLNEEVSMENEQQSSILSQSQNDEDIVEIEASTSDTHPPLCTCQCHQTISNAQSANEYLQFEQALRQTRQEQQQDRSLNNNRLIQTLKRQHEDLMNFYQKQLYKSKIDREQQTTKINQHDSQIQTDISTIQQQPPPPQNLRPTTLQINGKHSTPNSKGPPATSIRPFNSFLTPIRTTGPSLQQLIPCLTTTSTATTTTLTNKTALVKKTTLVAATNPQPSILPTTSHDIVDLTEEDDDNNNTNTNTNGVSIPIKLQQSPATPTPVTTNIQPTNRSNSMTPLGQTFPLRPLPECPKCDHTIARPQLSIAQDNTTVRLTWNLPSTPVESIKNYEIYAYKQSSVVSTTDWKKIGKVDSMRLPMAVTLKEFQSNSYYAFAVRGISNTNNIGPFCEPKIILTGNAPV